MSDAVSAAAVATFVVMGAGVDLARRRIPWWTSLPMTAAGLAAGPDLIAAIAGAVLGAILVDVAGFPGPWGGDSKATMAVGAWLGPGGVAVALCGAFLLTLAVWRWGGARAWPWGPILAAGVLAQLAARGLWG